MQIHHRHDWNVSPQEAIELQKTLASEVISNKPIDIASVKLVAGVDVSVKENVSQAAVVILRYPELEVIETVVAKRPTPFPYIPGLLSYREGPVLEEAFQNLKNEPDIFIFDGMGIMHPRRIGIASHMGVWLQKPTVGCGKTYFLGTYDEPAQERGASSLVHHKGDIIGAVLRTRPNVKPVYISPGNLADLPTSLDFVLRCTPKYRLPEPIRQAHNAAGKF
ncbi:MAG: deoxyribonuclease V [Anaerolineaceae bacterium]|nr:deoxyribonuclease V [Anaerolineaceae bacterium]